MSERESEQDKTDETGISDDQLPEDLVPSEDNPLAEGLDAGETVDGMMDGKKAEESEDSDDSGDSGGDSGGGSDDDSDDDTED